MFKRKKREKYAATLLPAETAVLCDPEDESTMWVEFPDGLRLIFTDGDYCGFYWAGEEHKRIEGSMAEEDEE